MLLFLFFDNVEEYYNYKFIFFYFPRCRHVEMAVAKPIRLPENETSLKNVHVELLCFLL